MIVLMSALAQAGEVSAIDERLLDARLPDPTTATIQSTVLGFGAGHFYAGDTRRGAIFAGLQAVSVGLAVYAFTDPGNGLGADSQSVLFGVGVWGLGLSRAADVFLAPQTAHSQREAMIRQQYGGR